jgi:sulfate adenylyltransferase large subunit
MTAHPRATDLIPRSASPSPLGEHSSLLRLIACGSVDHGKSTLLGRLLYESNQLFDDQLDALASDSRKFGTQGGELDFSLLLDGLAAEREQNITIDVAYRFFATPRRKFIVIDAPGHEQYTANMATGASIAELALVVVAADDGLALQTKRHLVVLSMLGIRNIVLAVNKMDRAGWSQDAFRSIEAQFRQFAAGLGFTDIVAIPVSATGGDNVVACSAHTAWYRGATLLEYLDHVEPVRAAPAAPFRMPIQLVSRPDPQFRGYGGLITSGAVHVGMAVRIFPSGHMSRIVRIVTFDGDLTRAAAGRSVTLTFADDFEASRGDLVSGIEQVPAVTDRIDARLFWMSSDGLTPGKNYLCKLATNSATARVEPDISVFDLDQRQLVGGQTIAQNEIGVATLVFDRPIAVDRYADGKHTGSFILIDPESYDTVAMGCVEQIAAPRKSWPATGPTKQTSAARAGLARWSETHARSLAKAVSWRTTGSIDTFVVTFVISGNTKLAGTVALTEVVTKVFIYYCHERIWAWVPWGRRMAKPVVAQEPAASG